jgi:CheY-like chemotaxis protein
MNGKKILIVDDDKDVLRGLNVRLRASGYTVASATDAIQAISVAQQEKPDAIILDIGLPGGDGFVVMGRLRSLIPLAHIPIIILTGQDPIINREKAISAGAQAFLQKPVDNDVLLSAIRKALGEPGGQVWKKHYSAKKEADTTGKKILVVDDDKDVLRGLNARLRANGYTVASATDAIQAISVAQQEKPDAIILDIGLPAGDGFVVMERLRSLIPLAHIPIIILTGQDPITNREKAINAGAQAFLQKPVDSVVLLQAIRKALGESKRQMQEKM